MTSLLACNQIWARLLGMSPSEAKLGEMHFSFGSSWKAIPVILVICGCGLWFFVSYWKDGSRPNWKFKGLLLFLRMFAVSSLFLILAQPVLRMSQQRNQRPTALLLLDSSQSMSFLDTRLSDPRLNMEASGTGLAPGELKKLNRLSRINAILNHGKAITRLDRDFQLKSYSFDTSITQIALPSNASQRTNYHFNTIPNPTTGDTTQIGTALAAISNEHSGQAVSGALVMSDGESNLGSDAILAAQSSYQSGIRISTMGVGDPTPTKDIALLSVLSDDVVRVNNTVSVYAAISQRGYAGKMVMASFRRGSDILERKSIRLAPDETRQEIVFSYIPKQAGRFDYSITIDTLDGEVSSANNKRGYTQAVISKKLRVLYIENEPRYEFRYLRNAILRDNSLEFACLLISGDADDSKPQGNIPIHTFPKTEKELFAYDILVIGDVPRSYFSETQLQSIRRFVEDRGASLLVIAGEQHMPQEYSSTPLEPVLPIIPGHSNSNASESPFPWQLTQEGRRSAVMQMEEDSVRSADVWRSLPGMYWVAGVQRTHPGATVLAVHPTLRNQDGLVPLVALQPFGSGKSFIQLADSTYLWRKRVGDRYFYRYWGQVFRSLTPKELPGNSRFVQLNADRSSYRLGEHVNLSARLLNAYYRPVKAEAVTVQIESGGQHRDLTLQSTPGSPGLFTAQFQPERAGKWSASLVSPQNSQAKAVTSFQVERLALESQKPELDEVLLRKVAAAGGGKYYAPSELKKWMDSLSSRQLVLNSELEIELWDTPLMFILFLTPLTIEWLLRKKKGLL